MPSSRCSSKRSRRRPASGGSVASSCMPRSSVRIAVRKLPPSTSRLPSSSRDSAVLHCCARACRRRSTLLRPTPSRRPASALFPLASVSACSSSSVSAAASLSSPSSAISACANAVRETVAAARGRNASSAAASTSVVSDSTAIRSIRLRSSRTWPGHGRRHRRSMASGVKTSRRGWRATKWVINAGMSSRRSARPGTSSTSTASR